MVFHRSLKANINLLRLTSPNRAQIKLEIECVDFVETIWVESTSLRWKWFSEKKCFSFLAWNERLRINSIMN